MLGLAYGSHEPLLPVVFSSTLPFEGRNFFFWRGSASSWEVFGQFSMVYFHK